MNVTNYFISKMNNTINKDQKYPTDEEYNFVHNHTFYGLPASYKYYLRVQNTEHKKYKNIAKGVALFPLDFAKASVIFAVESVILVGHCVLLTTALVTGVL